MKLIPLTKGRFAKVDDWWYDSLVKLGNWFFHEKREGDGYAAMSSCGDIVYMHDMIKRANDGETLDHINLDKLDNQEHNLRSATVSQQTANRSTRSDNLTSGVPGVSWDKTAKTWRVYTNKDGKRICLGLRKNLEDAIKLRNEGTITVHGEFTRVFKVDGSSVSAKQQVERQVI